MGENTRQHKKSYDELGFTDDYLFCRILMENEDLCIELAEMITGRTIKSILRTETQKSVQLSYDGKGIRFDVYFEDEENVVYDIEMQAVKKYDLSKRSRYYQGMVDLNVLSKGDGYDTLKDSYIIFICTFDEFGSGRHVYSFENLCIEDPQIRLRDGSHKVFLCRFRQERLLRKNERFSGLYRRQENIRKPLQTPAKRSREIQIAR